MLIINIFRAYFDWYQQVGNDETVNRYKQRKSLI